MPAGRGGRLGIVLRRTRLPHFSLLRRFTLRRNCADGVLGFRQHQRCGLPLNAPHCALQAAGAEKQSSTIDTFKEVGGLPPYLSCREVAVSYVQWRCDRCCDGAQLLRYGGGTDHHLPEVTLHHIRVDYLRTGRGSHGAVS